MSIIENYQIIQDLKNEVKSLLIPRIIKDYKEVGEKIKAGLYEMELNDLVAYEKQAKTTKGQEIFLIFSLSCSLLKGKKNAFYLKNPPVEILRREVKDVTKLERLSNDNKNRDVMMDRVVVSLTSGLDVFFC
ncbi:hypothetical protein JT164_05170 [Helicobacter pylori]|nr:hypothetical protein [Helicobacter pylori]